MALADFRNSIITQDKFSATFRKFDQGVQTSARGIDKLGAVISGGGAGMLFGAVAGAAGVAAIGKTVWSLGELGAQSLTTKSSFENLMSAVGQSPALLDRLSAAAGGTVTEMTLMQQANSALAGTTGQLSQEMAAALPKLLEAGRAAAKLNPAYGDAAFMFQSLVSGVKRGTPMLIDNTGITLKVGEANEAYAKSIGKTVTELTAQERSLAILRATLEGADTLIAQAGGSSGDMASDFVRANVAIQEMKTSLGELFAPAVAAIARSIADAASDVREVLVSTPYSRLQAEARGYVDEIERLQSMKVDRGAFLGGDTNVLQSEEERAQLIREATDAYNRLVSEMYELTKAENAAKMAGQNYKRLLVEYGTSAHDAATASATFSDQLAGLIATARGGGAAMQSLIGYINGVTAAAGATGSTRAFLGGVDVFSQQQYVAITQQRIDFERALNVQVAAHILTQEQADYQLATFDQRVNDHIGTLRSQATAMGNVSSSYDKLKGLIGQQLKPTFDLSGLTGGVLGGMGGDTWDEAYKRLAAVALRPEELQIHAQDWAGTFEKAGLTGLSPEDAQAEAKRIVENFSKGLDFSLIDSEKIKDSVRQAIKAEELYQSVVDEIYAEMGKENTKLNSAFYKMGSNGAKQATQALKDGAPAIVGAWVDVLIDPLMVRMRQNEARYNQ